MTKDEFWTLFVNEDVSVYIDNDDEAEEFKFFCVQHLISIPTPIESDHSYRYHCSGYIFRASIRGWYQSKTARDAGAYRKFEITWAELRDEENTTDDYSDMFLEMLGLKN